MVATKQAGWNFSRVGVERWVWKFPNEFFGVLYCTDSCLQVQFSVMKIAQQHSEFAFQNLGDIYF